MEFDDYFTLADAAKLLGISKAQVSRLIKDGRIEAARPGGPMVLVLKASAAQYKSTRRKPGRPPATPQPPAPKRRGKKSG